MPLQELLEVAIGLIFMWLIISIAVMQVQEWVNSYLGKRSSQLENIIRKMLMDRALGDQFYNHPLIKSLSITPQDSKSKKSSKPSKPSYIPSDKFALVLFDIVMNARADSPNVTGGAVQTLEQFQQGIKSLGKVSPDLAKTLNTLIIGTESMATQSEKALAVARENIEHWFNDSMDRVSGWYKRNAQISAFFIGLIFAVTLNVDSIAIAATLWREPTLRQVIVAQAEKAPPPEVQAADPAAALRQVRNQLDELSLPIGWSFEAVPLNGKKCSFTPGPKDVFGFWINGECQKPATASETTNGISWIFVKLIGLAMTGGAAMQGAPFWFDILKKLINVRGTGVNPSEKEKKASG